MLDNVPLSAYVRAPKRQVDKDLVVVSQASVTTVQRSTVLHTATLPVTIVGLRWHLSVVREAGAAVIFGMWSIVVTRQGNTANTMSFTDGALFYTPEEDVIVFGSFGLLTGIDAQEIEGATKAMRKLKAGDSISLITRAADNTNIPTLFGVVQFFKKY